MTDPIKNAENQASGIAGQFVGGLIPWWVKLILVVLFVAVVVFMTWWSYHVVSKYMGDHDRAQEQLSVVSSKYAADEIAIKDMKACAAISPIVITKTIPIWLKAASDTSANLSKQQEIANDISNAPTSDDALMAPVLSSTFDRLYPPLPPTRKNSSGGNSPHT